MYKMTVDLDLKPFTEELKWYQLNTKKKCKGLIKDISGDIVEDAKKNLVANGTLKTGGLAKSITYKIDSSGYRVNINVGKAHGVFIEGGTKAHIIKPKRARALRFMLNGNVIYSKKVKHPGTKAKPFLALQ